MSTNAGGLNKRALLVGVNEYPNLPAYSQLRGCVNDVLIMKQTLEASFGFPSSNITTLVNEQATAARIREGLDQLCTDCQPNDIIVFHFSGHGSRMAAASEKPCGYDETIMPHDSGRMNPSFPTQVTPCDIRDTDIQAWLSRLTGKTSNVTLIFDSCHSGSITRVLPDSASEGTSLRWIEPDSVGNGNTSNIGAARNWGRESGSSGWLPSSDKYVLLAACAAEQGAYEMDHEENGVAGRNGALTFFLTREINQATSNTYRDIWEIVALKVNNRFQKQTPLLEGALDRKIFDVEDFVPTRYLLVSGREGDEVQLAGGAVHDVTVGSQWEIYPAGTRQTNGAETLPQGRVEITKVEAVTASGTIMGESMPQTIVEGGRAVEVMHLNSSKQMPVWLAPVPAAGDDSVVALRQLLLRSNLLRIANSPAEARALIVPSEQNSVGPDHDNLESFWEVFDQSQARLTAPSALAESDRMRILANLETLSRYQRVLELSHEKSKLKGQIDFVLLWKDANHQWQEHKDEQPVYEEGDVIAFRIANRSAIPIHVSVLDLGLSNSIRLLYPQSSASETISSKRSGEVESDIKSSGIVSVGIDPQNEIELCFPEDPGFPDPLDSAPATRGKEVFKLCVTTRRHDLRFLEQSGLRSESSKHPEHPFESLIYLATGTGSLRETRQKMAPDDEWFTIERAFWLERSN